MSWVQSVRIPSAFNTLPLTQIMQNWLVLNSIIQRTFHVSVCGRLLCTLE